MSDVAANDTFRHPSFWTGGTLRSFAAALLVLLAARLTWGWHFAAKVRAHVDASRARGEPVSVADVKFPDLPDSDNAFAIFVNAYAARAAGVDSPRSSVLEYADYPPYGPEWVQLAERSEAMNAKAFALARKARAVPGARVRATFDADLRAPIKGLNGARLLAERLNDGAQFMELRGDHVEAVGRLRDMLHIARAVRQDPSLACQAVAAGIDESACYRARVIGPGLRLRPADPRAAQVRAAVNELISDLLDERALADGLARALYADRIALTEQVRRSGAERWAIRPLAESQIAHEWAAFPSWIDAARARDWPAAKASIDRLLVASRNHVAEDRPLLGWLAGTGVTDRLSRYSRWFWEGVPYDRAIEKGFRTIAERRVTAVLLAMQLFRADRDRWPARLDELVPAYLKGVPGDPFRAGAPPVGYVVLPKALRDGGDRPLVYFDHGSADPVDPRAWREPMYDWHQSSSTPRRQYRDAARFRPGDLVGRKSGALAPRPDPDPSSEGVDNDPGKSDQPRQDQQEKRGPDRPQDE